MSRAVSNKARSKVTLKDISSKSGVSLATVSSILGGGSSNVRYNSVTRSRVLKEAASLNYLPLKSNNIGVLYCAEESNSILSSMGWLNYIAPMLTAIEIEATRCNKLISIYEHVVGSKILDPQQALPQILRRRNIDGLIITGKFDKKLLDCIDDSYIPYVLMNQDSSENHASLPVVNFDDKHAGILATEYLFEKKCKNILHLSVDKPSNHYSVDQRILGYKHVMKKYNQLPVIELINSTSCVPECLTRQFSGVSSPDAIFTYDEESALACYRVMYEMGNIPVVPIVTIAWQNVRMVETLGIPHVLLPAGDLGKAAFDQLLFKLSEGSAVEPMLLQGSLCRMDLLMKKNLGR